MIRPRSNSLYCGTFLEWPCPRSPYFGWDPHVLSWFALVRCPFWWRHLWERLPKWWCSRIGPLLPIAVPLYHPSRHPVISTVVATLTYPCRPRLLVRWASSGCPQEVGVDSLPHPVCRSPLHCWWHLVPQVGFPSWAVLVLLHVPTTLHSPWILQLGWAELDVHDSKGQDPGCISWAYSADSNKNACRFPQTYHAKNSKPNCSHSKVRDSHLYRCFTFPTWIKLTNTPRCVPHILTGNVGLIITQCLRQNKSITNLWQTVTQSTSNCQQMHKSPHNCKTDHSGFCA